MANFRMASDCSSDTLGENTGQVPKPTFEIRNPLFPRFLYRNPGVGVEPWRIGMAGLDPRLIDRPIGQNKIFPNQIKKKKIKQ